MRLSNQKESVIREIKEACKFVEVLENVIEESALGSARSLIHHIKEKLDSAMQLGGNEHLGKTNEELTKEYLESKKAKWTKPILYSERSRLKLFIIFLNGKPLAEANHKDICHFIDSLARKKLREGTIQRYISRIWSLFKYLQKEYEFDIPDLSDIRASEYRGKIPSAHKREVLSREEIRALIQAPGNLRDRLIIAMLYYLALRVMELANLRLGNVNPKTGIVWVERGKGGESRWVWYPVERIGWLVNLWLERERATYYNSGNNEGFFVTKMGRKLYPILIWKIVVQAAEKAGIQSVVGRDALGRPIYRVTPHVLRHTHVGHAEEDGIPKRVTQMMLGHKHLSTTLQYGMPRPEKLFAPYKKFKGV